MLDLPKITLVAIAGTRIPEHIKALRKSMKGINYAKVILFTHENVSLEGITVIPIEKIDYKAYNHFVLYRLKDYIDTPFTLLVQHDGYVLRPDKWTNEFLKYDYIGAPWKKGVHFTDGGKNVRVGNGGFTLRSKKLLETPSILKLPFTDNGTGFFHEDGVLCVYHREILEEHGVRFAPVSVASKFSKEVNLSDSEKYTFGFHNIRNIPRLFFLRPLFKKIGLDI